MAIPAVQQVGERQLALYEAGAGAARRAADRDVRTAGLCAGCQAREARYGFRDARGARRSRTLWFQCFRSALGRRRDVAERMARGWNATQTGLPLADTLDALRTRRRRAQIKARHLLDDQRAV